MLRVTPSAILKRAKSSSIAQFAVQRDYDQLNRPHAHIVAAVVCPPPNGTGKLHKVEARLYAPAGTISPTWVSCDCGNFRYTWEVADMLAHSSSVKYSNGALPNIRNPQKVTALCKHLARLLSYATRARKVSKVIFEIPADEIKRVKPIMKQRGVPQKLPRRQRPQLVSKK